MVAVDQKTRSLIPLGRRISEIMQEKGDAFTIRAFAQRLKLNRESMRKSLAGERPLFSEELELIINGLGITLDRLKQIDTYEKEKDLIGILEGKTRNKVTLERANRLANDLAEVAIGATERGYSLNNLGKVQFIQKEREKAHSTWLKALAYAKKIHEQYNDSDLLYLVTANLLLSSTARKDYSNIEEIIQFLEQTLPENPKVMGTIYYTRMRVQKDLGDLHSAKQYSYRSLEHYERACNAKDIGHALMNVGYMEYLVGDYKTAARVLRNAIKVLEPYEDILVLAVKNYLKPLAKMRDSEKARNVVETYKAQAMQYPELWGKIQILYTVLADDPIHAEGVCNDSSMPFNIRAYACKCLFEFYVNKGDSDSAIRYYEMGRIYTSSSSKADFYDGEDY